MWELARRALLGALTLCLLSNVVDLSIPATPKNAAKSATPCKLSEFYCDTGQCLPLDKFCNGADDCGDKSDEPKYCTRK